MESTAPRHDWQPPIELQGSTRRDVQLTGYGKALVVAGVVFIAIAVVGAAALATQAESNARRWAAWRAEAVPTVGVVRGMSKKSDGENTEYYLHLSYRIHERDYFATVKMNYREWRKWHEGDDVEIFYPRSNPSRGWIRGHEPRGVSWPLPPIFGVSLLIPVPIFAYKLNRQRRLLEEGHPAVATVVAKKKVSSEDGSYYRISYQYEAGAGAPRQGRCNLYKKPPEIGDRFPVLYHPEHESWSARYPLRLVRVRRYE